MVTCLASFLPALVIGIELVQWVRRGITFEVPFEKLLACLAKES
jgi:hypothetical protein